MRSTLAAQLLLLLPFAAGHGNHGDPHALCNVQGYSKGDSKPYYVTKDPKQATQQGCTLLCATDHRCKSYAVGKGRCKMYQGDVAHHVNRDKSSPYVFHDRGCISHWATVSAEVSSRAAEHMASASARAAAMAAQQSASNAAARSSAQAAAQARAASASAAVKTPSPSPPKASSAAPIVCGREGFAPGDPSAFTYDWTEPQLNFATCKDLCSSSSCTNFAYGSGTCLVYQTSGVKAALEEDNDSPYSFFDAPCLGAMSIPQY